MDAAKRLLLLSFAFLFPSIVACISLELPSLPVRRTANETTQVLDPFRPPWPSVAIEILSGSVDHNDLTSPVDVYVKLSVSGTYVGRTIPDWDTHWPKWNKKFRVHWLHPDDLIEFHLFDYDLLTSDDLLGSLNTTLGQILETNRNGKQVRLKFLHGYLIVRLTVVQVPACGQSGRRQRASKLARIKGGRSAEEGEFPWQVSLQKWDELAGVWSHFCGGTILNDQFIITAAHCVSGDDSLNIRAYVGSATLTASRTFSDHVANHSERNSTFYNIAEIVNHEDYNEDNNAHDLAVLRTRNRIHFTRSEHGGHYLVNAICLPPPDLNYDRKIATATGWGHSAEEEQPDRLQKVDLLILKDWSCADIYNMLELGENWHEAIMLCAYGDGKDTKRGDSGGPLIMYRAGRAHLVGVTSWGLPLIIEVLFDLVDKNFTVPGGYTEISSFLSWLEENANSFNATHFISAG